MNAKTDRELLRAYALERSEAAFAELVRRHIHLVYAVALRQVVDPHLAEDATQGTFVALAQNARKLLARSVLSSWLHLTARNVATKLVRSEERRRAREKAAVAMDLETAEPEQLWSRVAPHLDEVVASLTDKERDALMLRFFEQKSAREMAGVLGVSEEAAQRRVSRAVERLRGLLARRGVAVGASGLVLVLSAKATQAAPASLAGIILSALSTGTVLQTATTTAGLKAVTMTTIQKGLVAVVLVAALGTVAHRAHQLSIARGKVEALGQGQLALAEQVRQLERERDQATNLLATAQEDNGRLKSGQVLAEVLRLRGQVGALRQELATNEAGAHPTLMSRLVRDPAMKQQIYEETRQWVRGVMDPIIKDLKLTPEQVDKATRMCAEAGLREIERFATMTPGTLSQAELRQIEENLLTDLYEQLLPVVGENGIARIKTLHEELPAQTTVSLLNGQLGAEQLSDEQSTHLVQIVKAEPLDLTWGIARSDVAFWGKPQDIQEHLAKIEASNEHVLQQAGSFLNPAQVSALSMVLSNGINCRVVQASAYIQQR